MPDSKLQTAPADLTAICVRMPGNALVDAECTHLTGAAPDTDGFARCQTIEHIPDAAYIRMGLHLLTGGSTLDDLLDAVRQADFAADEFRIETLSLAKAKHSSLQKAVLALADAILFYPNLSHPKHRFLLLEHQNGLWFGEILKTCDHTYRPHKSRPYNTSSSLPHRLSRALVNLVRPRARSLVDPCCGTGSILLEACALGMQAYGADQNKRMVGMARQNLAHFGYDARVDHADARTYQQNADALVTNLPYGRFLQTDETIIRAILERGRELAPVAVYVTEHKISNWLRAAGYQDIEVYPVIKHDGFARYVYLAE